MINKRIAIRGVKFDDLIAKVMTKYSGQEIKLCKS